MSWLELPDGSRMELFGSGGGQRVADSLTRSVGADVPLLGQVPLDATLREGGDGGVPVVLAHPDSAGAVALRGVARRWPARPRPGRPLARPHPRGALTRPDDDVRGPPGSYSLRAPSCARPPVPVPTPPAERGQRVPEHPGRRSGRALSRRGPCGRGTRVAAA